MPRIRSVISSLPDQPGFEGLKAVNTPSAPQMELPQEVQLWLDSFDFTGTEMDTWLKQLVENTDQSSHV
jgi:hypothetical protein